MPENFVATVSRFLGERGPVVETFTVVPYALPSPHEPGPGVVMSPYRCVNTGGGDVVVPGMWSTGGDIPQIRVPMCPH